MQAVGSFFWLSLGVTPDLEKAVPFSPSLRMPLGPWSCLILLEICTVCPGWKLTRQLKEFLSSSVVKSCSEIGSWYSDPDRNFFKAFSPKEIKDNAVGWVDQSIISFKPQPNFLWNWEQLSHLYKTRKTALEAIQKFTVPFYQSPNLPCLS